jgi:chalcone isomerase-like protein
MKYSLPKYIYNISALSFLILIQFVTLNAYADDNTIPDSVYFKDEELDLLGDGIRREFLLDVYQIGFYSDVKDISKLVKTAAEFPLAIRIKVLTNLLPDEPPSHWVTLFSKVLNEEQFEIFITHYAMLQEGDVLAINFRPEKGSSISIRGNRIININDADFIRVVIDGFIGSEPVSTDLKESILSS